MIYSQVSDAQASDSQLSDSQLSDSHHSFVWIFNEDFHPYNDERLKHAELYKYYTEYYGYLK
uniref:Uncharacterized protein n=1 Tax=Romanomermis culicivorax TaxID=13658 RepID=A0A915J351_ROMCU